MNADPTAPPTEQTLRVVRATEHEWAAVRDVRLAALADSPAAFGSTLSEEQQLDESRWRRWAASRAVFLVAGAHRPCGIAAFVAGDAEATRKVVSVWVDPARRGQGAGGRLLDAVARAARDDGAARLHLWCTHGNTSARRLYERSGYIATGRTRTHPGDPRLRMDEMALPLG
jgi:GNAT superfamily N-acetyltransferase